MPQVGKALRGHELARDGLLSSPVWTESLNTLLTSFADITILRAASADAQIWGATAPDQGLVLPVAATRCVCWANITFQDPPSGLVTWKLRKNGGTVAGVQGGHAGAVPASGSLIILWNAAVNFLAGDTWAVTAEQSAPGVGVGISAALTVAFFP